MSYNEFIVLHPSIDLILGIVKGLGPTLVALLAIVLNHKNTVKRDKENRKIHCIIQFKKKCLINLSNYPSYNGARELV